MTEPHDLREEEEDEEHDRMRAWVKRSLAESAIVGKTPNLLPGVHRRLRRRSRGKFFADGWSTAHVQTRYTLIGLMTLLLVIVACYVLAPWPIH